MPWQPPIPAGALYSKAARDLGPALPLLAYCYDLVQRDGWCNILLKDAANDLEEPYQNIKRWWAALRDGPFFCEMIDRGKNGWRVKFKAVWIDWRILSTRPTVKDISSTNEVPEMELESDEVQIKYKSSTNQGSEMIPEPRMYKVLHTDQESSPPTSLNAVAINGHKPAPDPAVVVMMYDKGFTSSPAINQIALMGIDSETLSASVDNLRADGWKDNGRIMRRLQEHPPEPGKPYQRSRASPKSSPPIPTRPPVPDDILTPAQIAERSRRLRPETNRHDT